MVHGDIMSRFSLFVLAFDKRDEKGLGSADLRLRGRTITDTMRLNWHREE